MKLRYFLMRAYLFEVLTIFMKNVNLHVTGYLALRKKCPYSKSFWSAFFPHFSVFGLNMERYSARIRKNAGKMREKCGPE